MDVSIVIVSWNTRALLRRCLGSIERTVQNIAHEVIVVDNGSTDATVKMVTQEFPRVTLLCNDENRGFAAANNQGIRAGRGRYVLLLNSDAVLESGAVRLVTDYLDEHRDVGIVGGQLHNPDGSFQWSFADFPSLASETLLLTGLSRWLRPSVYPSYPESASQVGCPVDWVSGAFLMARRQATEAVGLLDEDFFMYSEEVDWCYRMKRRGWKVQYLPEVRIVHFSGGSSRRALVRKRAQLYRSKWLFLLKHRGAAVATTFRILVWVVSSAKLLTWAATGLTTNAIRRARAQQNVSAYRFLLTNF